MSRYTIYFIVSIACVLCVLGIIFALPLFILGVLVGGTAVFVEAFVDDVKRRLDRRSRDRLIKKYGIHTSDR